MAETWTKLTEKPSNLTGLKVIFTSISGIWSYPGTNVKNITFKSDNENFIKLMYEYNESKETYGMYYYRSTSDADRIFVIGSGHTWGKEAYKTLEITSGTDVTNTELIDYFWESGDIYRKEIEIEGIQAQINRITDNISAAYDAIEEKGGTIPTSKNSDNLASAIETISIETYDGTVEIPFSGIPIGGKVFLDNGDNGATYQFYDVDKNEITYTDISSLNNAAYYIVNGAPTTDRFYVVAADSSKSDYNSTYGVNIGASKYWGYYEIDTEAYTNTIGSGKTNTAKALAITDTSGYASSSIWKWLNDINTDEYGGCSDWFIGSRAEYNALSDSTKAGSLFYNKELWSSVEDSNRKAYVYASEMGRWSSTNKSGNYNVLAFRAF